MMTEAQVHKVRFEPVGIEMEVEEAKPCLRGVSSGHLAYARLQGRAVWQLQVETD